MLPILAVTAVAALVTALVMMLAAATGTIAAAHVAFAVGILPLILSAMTHFVPVLTRGRPPGRTLQVVPLTALSAGVLAATGFTLPSFYAVGIHAGAGLALVTALFMAGWIAARARAALGAPHPCLRWYLAAVLLLALALMAILAMQLWPGSHAALRAFHLHLNTLGFIGLTALGTLAVLLPTAAARPDKGAARRLKTDLPTAIAGVLLVAAGAAWAKPAAYVGLVLLLIPVVRLGTAWTVQFWHEMSAADGATPSLALALFGLVALLILGAGHANSWLYGADMIVGFVLAFLLPLVTGAVSQLLPLWLKPGVQTVWHEATRRRLGRFAGLRALSFVAAGVAVALGFPAMALLAGAALTLAVVQMAPVFSRR